MYKITNIETLGTDYTVANQDGKIIKHVQIIAHTDILNAALGTVPESGDTCITTTSTTTTIWSTTTTTSTLIP